MTSDKLLQNFGIELLVLVLLGMFYIIIRYIALRRPISYAEFEKAFFIAAALGISAAVTFFLLR